MYSKGRGVPKDEQKAADWYRKAAAADAEGAERGDVSAESSLGYAYSIGQGVPRDYKRAVELLASAARRGDHVAQYNLSFMFAQGLGVEKDPKTATEWYNQACPPICKLDSNGLAQEDGSD